MKRFLLACASALTLLPLASCRATGGSDAKDVALGDVVRTSNGAVAVQIAVYYSDGRDVVRVNCPVGQRAVGNWRAACPNETHRISVDGFKKAMRKLYTDKYGSFGQAEETALGQTITALGDANNTYDAGNFGAVSSKFLPFMLSAVAADDDGIGPTTPVNPNNNGGNNGARAGSLLPAVVGVTLPANRNGAEFVIDNKSGRQFSTLRTELSASCPFRVTNLTAGLGGLRGQVDFVSQNFSGTSATWTLGQTVQPVRLIVQLSGQPGTCNFDIFDASNGGGGGGGGGNGVSDPYIMAIFSFQGNMGFLDPDSTHTFALYARMDPKTQRMVEHVPLSWLPVNIQGGKPVYDANGNLTVGAIQTRGGQPRPGWAFGFDPTVSPLIARSQPLTKHGVFRISKDLYDKAKAWRDTLNTNTRNWLNSNRLGSRYLYVADDRYAFKPCVTPTPDAFNCFHAVIALTGSCMATGVLSGDPVTINVVKLYKQLGLIPANPATNDSNVIADLVDQAIQLERRQGGVDRP